jgi:hypothetical protein
MQRKETSLEVTYHLMQHSTGKVYAVRIDQQPNHPSGSLRERGDSVLEAYEPLSAALLCERHLDPWDYPPELRIADLTWVQEALWKDLFLFSCPDDVDTHRGWTGSFYEGWHAGFTFGNTHPDVSDAEVDEVAMHTEHIATDWCEAEQREKQWTEFVNGFFSGCMVALGRYIEDVSAIGGSEG